MHHVQKGYEFLIYTGIDHVLLRMLRSEITPDMSTRICVDGAADE